MIKLYKKVVNQDEIRIPFLPSEDDFSIKVFRPTIIKMGLDNSEKLKRFLWYLITFGRLRIFYILDGNQVVHYSFIIPKNFRFPFMNNDDLQIGPCYTDTNYRGKGLYTRALKMIPLIFHEQANTFWVYTTEENLISQHVIEKAGYIFHGIVKSSGLLRVLITIND